MKTYYDLTKKEKKEYEKEFKKTEVGKDMYSKKILLEVLIGLFFFIYGFIVGYTSGIEEYLDQSATMLVDFFQLILFGTIFIGYAYEVYININFTSWLKNKHNIKRW